MWEITKKTLNQAQGQMNAVASMLEDDRYCIDISHQILATISLLKKANGLLLKEHIEKCVVESFENDNGEEKIEEVLKVLNKLIDS